MDYHESEKLMRAKVLVKDPHFHMFSLWEPIRLSQNQESGESSLYHMALAGVQEEE